MGILESQFGGPSLPSPRSLSELCVGNAQVVQGLNSTLAREEVTGEETPRAAWGSRPLQPRETSSC